MSKKLRERKFTVYGCVEGDREHYFIDYLREVYRPQDNNIAFYPERSSGGSPDKIVSSAIQKCDRDRSFAWLDEDFEPLTPLSRGVRESLADRWNIHDESTKEQFYLCPLRDLQSLHNPFKRNPVLIVSQPVCCESIILQALGKSPCCPRYNPDIRASQIKKLKNQVVTLLNGKNETAFYTESISLETLEERRQAIALLDLLVSMMINKP